MMQPAHSSAKISGLGLGGVASAVSRCVRRLPNYLVGHLRTRRFGLSSGENSRSTGFFDMYVLWSSGCTKFELMLPQ